MLKNLAFVAAGVLIAAPALADHNDHQRPQWKRHPHRPVIIVVPPPRVIYRPADVYYYIPPPRPPAHSYTPPLIYSPPQTGI